MTVDLIVELTHRDIACKHGCVGYCLHLKVAEDRKFEQFRRQQHAIREALIDQQAFDEYRLQLIEFFDYRQMLIARYT